MRHEVTAPLKGVLSAGLQIFGYTSITPVDDAKDAIEHGHPIQIIIKQAIKRLRSADTPDATFIADTLKELV